MKNQTTVFLVQHTNPETEDIKLIGVFSDRDLADKAVAGLLDKPGFSKSQDGFHVDTITLDKPAWQEGFGVSSD